ncbi:MAG: radical SAM family heme chaperone HemW [Thermodesulfobacteriota bacterium]
MTPDEPMNGLYVHIPFCRSKCGYCAFVSFPIKNSAPGSYLTALYKEIDFWSKRVQDDKFGSLFIGGGTPTILSTAELTELLTVLKDKFAFSATAEITIESNPNTVDLAKLTELRKNGVNRLSIGIQSFSDQTLRLIERSHTVAEGIEAAYLARQAGFENLNLDLIYGLPGQTIAEWQDTLGEALALKPDHLSAYQLSIDRGSRFAEKVEQGNLQLPDDDQVAIMAEDTLAIMSSTPLERYEISNYARPGHRCRHNLIYWHNGSYLGLGAGAVANWSGLRIRNTPNPKLYAKRLLNSETAWLETEALPREASFRETVVMGLRLPKGIDLNSLQERFDLDPEEYYGEILQTLTRRKMIEIVAGRLRLTEAALPFANQALGELV